MSQLLFRKTKILIYKTPVRPVLKYSAKTWTITKKHEGRLSSKGNSFTECLVQHVREGSNRRDTIEN
jgi:hypothetical protein